MGTTSYPECPLRIGWTLENHISVNPDAKVLGGFGDSFILQLVDSLEAQGLMITDLIMLMHRVNHAL